MVPAPRRYAATERAALVHQRGHRHRPAVADVAERCPSGMRASVKVHLVELGLPGELAQGPVSTPGACMSMTK